MGRRNNIPPDQRICPMCKIGVEDEYHALFLCNKLEQIRQEFLRTTPEQQNRALDKNSKLTKLFSSEIDNELYLRKIGRYCKRTIRKEEKNPRR